MAIDFSALNRNDKKTHSDPVELFSTIINKKYDGLRPGQQEVLAEWARKKDLYRDTAIQMNTGGGKTLVGLLIAQYCMDDKHAPSVYLARDSSLAQQVLDEARDNGLSATLDPKDVTFLSSESILVTTVHKLFNGKTVFNRLDSGLALKCGCLIIDDCHTAIRIVQEQFSLKVPQGTEDYEALVDLFSDNLKEEDPSKFYKLQQGSDDCAFLPLSPIDYCRQFDECFSILSHSRLLQTNDDYKFTFPLVSECLKYASVTFSSGCVEFTPYCPNVNAISTYATASKRVYLSATFSGLDELTTELGANIGQDSIISPSRASDCGDRLVVSPGSISPSIREEDIYSLAMDLSLRNDANLTRGPINTVVLVPSFARARLWEQCANATVLTKDNIDDYIRQLATGKCVGITVLVNRYDGIDLPGDACRLLIIDGGVSFLFGGYRQREMTALQNTPIHHRYIAQTLEQGMGRGVRSSDDYCAVLLMGQEASVSIRSQSRKALYSPVLRMQIDFSNEVVNIMRAAEATPTECLKETLEQFINRDGDLLLAAKRMVANASYEHQRNPSALAKARRDAFEYARKGDLANARSSLNEGINSTDDTNTAGWFMEELAGYQAWTNIPSARKTLQSAIAKNIYVSGHAQIIKRPVSTKPLVNQAQAIKELCKKFTDAADVYDFFYGPIDRFVWGQRGYSDVDEEAIRLIGKAFGFTSTRPEKERNDGGPDNLWIISSQTLLIIELKADVSRDEHTIIKSDTEQLSSSIDWARRVYPQYTHIPVLLHPYRKEKRNANLPDGTRIITVEDWRRLTKHIREFAQIVSDNFNWHDTDMIAAGLAECNLNGRQILNSHSTTPQFK